MFAAYPHAILGWMASIFFGRAWIDVTLPEMLSRDLKQSRFIRHCAANIVKTAFKINEITVLFNVCFTSPFALPIFLGDGVGWRDVFAHVV